MRRVHLLFILVLGFMFSSCHKDEGIELNNMDYLIFGHFYGECIGDGCIQFFKLEESLLLKGTNHEYPHGDDFYNGNFIPLPEEDFLEVKDIVNYFPTDLLNEENIVIGQPDAGDWGGIYIEYKDSEVRKRWFLDKMTDNVSQKYHEFISKVNEKIQQLQ